MDRYQEILQQYWGYSDFRGIQREIIESVMAGKDTLGLMPTGGGKSITFQVPAMVLEGVCIVITPLIALMKDQVQNLRSRGISADAIYAGKSWPEIVKTLDNCIFGGTKILYVSPERLSTEIFQTKLRHMPVSLITVDEAHCISQWGYDFRPSYLRIADIRKLKPDVPVLALTATATPEVVDDIQDKLHFPHHCVFKMSFERKNLSYVVRYTGAKDDELIHILQCTQGSAIVYCRSRKRTKQIAQLLGEQSITATFYHAGLENAMKDERQKAWQHDEVRVMVATNAFGMGIDKPDVRMVIHADCPDSLEAYFQEAGRAGRDGNKSYAVLLYDTSDARKLHKRIADTFPPKETIRDVYEHLAYYFQIGTESGKGKTFPFDIEQFSLIYKFFPTVVDSSLRILEQSGYLHYEDEPESRARVHFLVSRNELYMLDSLSANEDKVVTALLRHYGGLFTDLIYIEEAFVAESTGLTQQQVYMILKNLSARRIISFIPKRKIPFITYLRDRIPGERVFIPQEVWDKRRKQYVTRIESMLSYAQNDMTCRSRQLLAYFGEASSHNCGQCDVCLDHKGNDSSETHQTKLQQARTAIINMLSDGEAHHLRSFSTIPIPSRIIKEALEQLAAENMLHIDCEMISLG